VLERDSALSHKISRSSDNHSSSYSQKTIFIMAAVRHFEFAKFWYFVNQPTLEAQSASAYQISLKSDDFQRLTSLRKLNELIRSLHTFEILPPP